MKKLLSPTRFYLLIFLVLLPFFSFIGWFSYQVMREKERDQQFQQIAQYAANTLSKRREKNQFLKTHLNVSSSFFKNYFESLKLNQKETFALYQQSKHPLFLLDSEKNDRLQFLKSKNQFHFETTFLRKKGSISEYLEKQTQSVQIDEKDLEKILSVLENIQTDQFEPLSKAPFFIIEQMSLYPHSFGIFSLNMDIIRQEFSNEGINL